jgi:hypothetical protein
MKTLKEFVKATHINEKLVRAVVRQSGGWDSFKEDAPDVARHGVDGGFHGWIYYTETLRFTRNNKKAIMEALEEMAFSLGEGGVLKMVTDFGVFRNDPISEDEVARAVYQGKGERATDVLNVLAWFAMEEVSRSYADLLEE